MVRLEAVLGDRNVKAVSTTLSNIEKASADLPQLTRQASALAADLHRLSELDGATHHAPHGTLE